MTRIIVAYQPCSTRKRKTMGETVWDQHLRYFEARGEIINPRVSSGTNSSVFSTGEKQPGTRFC